MSDNLERIISTQTFSTADTRLVIIGKTGVGKSSTSNTLIGRVVFQAQVGASSVTKECQQSTAQRSGRTLQVVDTPGFFDTSVTNEIINKITECVAMSSPGPHAILFVIRIGRFTEEDTNTVDQVKKWFGEDMVKHMIIIFTGQDDLEADDVSIQDYISRSPASLKQLISQVNNRYLTINNRTSSADKDGFTQKVFSMVDKMLKDNGGKYYTTEMYRQAEQRVRQREEEEKRRREAEMRMQREEIEGSISSRFAKLLSDQNQQIEKLQNMKATLETTGQRSNVQYADKIAELNQKLSEAHQMHTQMNIDRVEWEKNLQLQINKSETERKSALDIFRSQWNTSISKKEADLQAYVVKVEQEQKARELEMQRRADEAEARRRKEEEEHKKKLAAIEAEKAQLNKYQEVVRAVQALPDGPIKQALLTRYVVPGSAAVEAIYNQHILNGYPIY